MQYNLLEFLTGFKDPRRGQGQRHPLPAFLAMILMAIISGHQGLKGFARFMKSNQAELVSIFQLKHGVPTFGTVRTLLQSIRPEELAARFAAWMEKHLVQEQDQWVALDGKALNSTVQDAQGSLQSFVYVVSAFAQRSGLVHHLRSFESGKAYEAEVVRQMVAQLGLQEAIVTLDALHCQKKH